MSKAALEKVKATVTRAVKAVKPRAKTHKFRAHFGSAHSVQLAGSFNAWAPEPMQPDGDGGWELKRVLPAGHYEYKFVVDGRWLLDPHSPLNAADGDGNVNSVLKLD